MKPPLRQPPPPPRDSWWAKPQTREEFSATAKQEANRMNAVQSTQHIQRREGDK